MPAGAGQRNHQLWNGGLEIGVRHLRSVFEASVPADGDRAEDYNFLVFVVDGGEQPSRFCLPSVWGAAAVEEGCHEEQRTRTARKSSLDHEFVSES